MQFLKHFVKKFFLHYLNCKKIYCLLRPLPAVLTHLKTNDTTITKHDVFVATTKHVKERKAGGEKAFNKNLLGDYFHTLFPPSPVSYVDVEDGERGWL